MSRRWLRYLSWRRVLLLTLLAALLPGIGLVVLRGLSAIEASGRIFTVDAVPPRPVAIVFGAQVLRSGNPSAMLVDRITAAAALYQAGKVQALLMTGDNHIETYNEPEAMRQYALRLGVPDDAIVLDYAGFRTYDSCYRARDVFQVREAILVTQDFHLDRALLVCNALGIDSVGVPADNMRSERYSMRALLSSELREFPATALSVLDLIRNEQPTYLGDPIPILNG